MEKRRRKIKALILDKLIRNFKPPPKNYDLLISHQVVSLVRSFPQFESQGKTQSHHLGYRC